ncbi:MAG TPA: radical SAM family heme chaperone HemW [Arenibacter sp.]|nr:radical SAM family heme chaperone HemW [Arenibacter sp.]
MGSIYIHIPFCKQACHYCDFHFSTNMGKKEMMVEALIKELELRKTEFADEEVHTIYFGGGTPSVLEISEIEEILAAARLHYKVATEPEITLEANPDDLSGDKIGALAASPINRLSIGVQSFFEADLKMMNRAHNAREAEVCIALATQFFNNVSIDLIYGIPGMTNEQWLANIEKALSFNIPHISSYALTVEPRTALRALIDKGLIAPVDDGAAAGHYQILCDRLHAEGYVNYEFSNFGKSGFFSRNNMAYWQGKKYIGIGPSAHSYDGIRRGWNISNNAKYIKSIAQDILPLETEELSKTDRYNEYIMTGLRTMWGVSLKRIKTDFGAEYHSYLMEQAEGKIRKKLMHREGDRLLISPSGKFLSDGIAADLFRVVANGQDYKEGPCGTDNIK